MNYENWIAFFSIVLVAAAIPGPAILLITTHSLQFGALRSLNAAAGNISGLFIMSTFSILGLSAVVSISSIVFTVIKFTGALYLLYMGIKIWRSGVHLETAKKSGDAEFSTWSLYSQGLLVSLTNPKAIVLTTALFPQFIVLTEPLLPQFLILVSTLMMCSFISLLSYSLLSQKLKSGTKQLASGRTLGKVVGTIFAGAGGALAISTQN